MHSKLPKKKRHSLMEYLKKHGELKSIAKTCGASVFLYILWGFMFLSFITYLRKRIKKDRNLPDQSLLSIRS